MNLRGWLTKKPRPAPAEPPELTEEAVQAVAAATAHWIALQKHPGWFLLVEELTNAAETAMERWAIGSLDPAESERLASRVQTLRWVLHLPIDKVANYNEMVKELEEAARTTREDDAPDGI